MKHIVILFSLLMLLSCGSGMDSIAINGVCEGYADAATSLYVLPWPAGTAYTTTQGNCSALSHFGEYRFSYDFDMEIGSDIAAVRDGTVFEVEESFTDGNGCPNDNHIFVKHSDGSMAAYLHLTKDGALVEPGAAVSQGDVIAKSGNTGCSTDPHLHFHVWEDDGKDETVPLTFQNAGVNPRGLIRGKKYTAE